MSRIQNIYIVMKTQPQYTVVKTQPQYTVMKSQTQYTVMKINRSIRLFKKPNSVYSYEAQPQYTVMSYNACNEAKKRQNGVTLGKRCSFVKYVPGKSIITKISVIIKRGKLTKRIISKSQRYK